MKRLTPVYAALILLACAGLAYAQPDPPSASAPELSRWPIRARLPARETPPDADLFRGEVSLGEGRARLSLRGVAGSETLVGRVRRRAAAGVTHYSGRLYPLAESAGAVGRLAGETRAAEAGVAFELHLDSSRARVHGRIGLRAFESLPAATQRTIVLVHGAWVDARSWEPFKRRLELAGYRVLAPEWPGLGTSRAGDHGPREIVAHYERIVRALPEPPLLIGHSFGGLWVQMLLDRGLGAAGVAIDSAPPQGVLLRGKAILANLPALRAAPFADVLTMSLDDFRYGFVNRLEPAAQVAAYERYVVPTTARVFRLGARLKVKVDYANTARAPLLLIGGGDDRTVTKEMVRANFAKYRDALADLPPAERPPVALREFRGRSHWIIAEPGWEEVADTALRWCEGWLEPALARAPRR